MQKLAPIITVEILSGQIDPLGMEKFLAYATYLPDGTYQLIIRKPRKPRSNPQNNYYFGVVLPLISDTTGFTDDEAHQAMKMLFLKKQVGKLFTIKSTSKLSTVEMEEYLENIRRFASAELNCYVPLPNEAEAPTP